MTAVKEMLKELQEKFPKQMADMYDTNQLLLEDIALKAKRTEKKEKVKFACEVYSIHYFNSQKISFREVAEEIINL